MSGSHQTYAFIDGQNLHLSIRSQGWVLDYGAFRRYLTDKFHVSKAKGKLAKLIVPDDTRYSSLYRNYTGDIMGLNKLRAKLELKKREA